MIIRSPLLEEFDWLEHGFGTRLTTDWPPGSGYANLRQIHSDLVVEAAADACGVLGEGDALVTRAPGVWIGVRTADCAPVILADPASRAVAVVHAGWRGAVAGVALRALEALGARRPQLAAAIGPTIGPCCFEVGSEVAEQFRPWWPERADLDRQTTVDLPETLRRQLIAAGVEPSRIDAAGECTRCGADRFHSFRRDREASGRMVTAVRIKE